MMQRLGENSMNINKLTGGIDSNSRSKVNNDSDPSVAAKKSGGDGTSSDQVKLSASSMNIQQIEAEVRQMPDVDDKTIDRIRDQIEKGEYKINYQQLAGKMLDFEEKLN